MTTLAIAGWRIRLECDHPRLVERVAVRYAAFLAPDEGAYDATVTVTVDPHLAHFGRLKATAMRRGGLSVLDKVGAYGMIILQQWQMLLDVSDEIVERPLEHALKYLMAYLALQHGGLLFHCAGLLIGGQVYLFTGRSGSGKSTVVALSPQAVALNDDMVLLRPDGLAWRAFGTPFWNADTTRRDGQTASGAVTGIYRLVQDRREYVEPVTTAVAASELVANCPVVNGDPVKLPVVMDRCRQLATVVPLRRLHFRKTPDFWELVQRRSIG